MNRCSSVLISKQVFIIRSWARSHMFKKLIVILLVVYSWPAGSQDMLGIVNSNFAGSNGISINPSSIANDKLKMDINILTVNAFVQNNYFYLPKRDASVFKVLSGAYTFPFAPKPYGDGERNVDTYYNDKAFKNIYVSTRLTGPSVMFRCKDHSFALHTGFRAVSSTRDFPYDIANFSYYSMDFHPQHNIQYKRDEYSMASLSWWEVGFTYATVIKRSYRSHWSAGITVNKLYGYSGAYLTGYQTDYVAYNDSILNVNNLNAEMGLALPMNYDTDVFDVTGDLVRGGGWSVDLGFTYQFKQRGYRQKPPNFCYKKRFEDYKYKIGVSLLDIGYVRMKENAEKHVYDNVSNHHINVSDMQYHDVHEAINDVSRILYNGDPDASYRDDEFTIYLPTALSVQFDYYYKNNWYLNAVLILPVHFTSPQIQRATVVAVVPRYETRSFEVSIPVSVYELKYLRIGLAMRFWDFSIGTEKMGGFFSNRDFTGMDIYFSYKINITGKPKGIYQGATCSR